MADDKGKSKDKDKAAPDLPPAKKGSKLRFLIVLLVTATICIALGVVATLQLLKVTGQKPAGGSAGHNSDAGESSDDATSKFPKDAQTVMFDDGFANIIMPDPNIPASKLMYKVSFLCSNKEVAELVMKNKSLFEAIITDLHNYRTRAEVDDPGLKQSIDKETLKRSNELLERLEQESSATNKILESVHTAWAVHE